MLELSSAPAAENPEVPSIEFFLEKSQEALEPIPQGQTLDCRQCKEHPTRLQIALKKGQGTQLQFILIFLKKTTQNNKTHPTLQHEKLKKTVNFDLKADTG